MRKIPTVYLRDETDRSKVTDEVNPECQWVLDGLGVPTRKYDGTCTMLDEHGRWWGRREVKPGKPEPANFQPEQRDLVTGKTVGWEPIEQSSFIKAFRGVANLPVRPGTYELCGPKVQGNPEHFEEHRLISHAFAEVPPPANRAPKDLVDLVSLRGWEGIVWHWAQPDGTVKMAKLKVRDLR